MATKRTDHVGIAGNVLLCEHCGTRQPIAVPQPLATAAAMMKAFSKSHAQCAQQPGVSAFRRATSLDDWPESDDRGASSNAIYRHFTTHFGTRSGTPPSGSIEARHPLDPSDFGRCYRLLLLAPDWRARIGVMAGYGPAWAALASHWEELTALYERELPTGLAPQLYARMQELLGAASKAEA